MSYYRKLPINSNKKLQSYIIGVALGDGNLSNPNGRAIRLRITCDKKYPLLIKHITNCLLSLLPKNKIAIVDRKNCIDISSYSNNWQKLLWRWDRGSKDKQNVAVPNWIKKDKNFTKECLRGLLQTDGSIYYDRNYLMINFVNTASNLSSDVFEMIKNLGHAPNLQKLKQKNGKIKYTVRIAKNTQKFIKKIGYWKK